jgi:hypothetical protein
VVNNSVFGRSRDGLVLMLRICLHRDTSLATGTTQSSTTRLTQMIAVRLTLLLHMFSIDVEDMEEEGQTHRNHLRESSGAGLGGTGSQT